MDQDAKTLLSMAIAASQANKTDEAIHLFQRAAEANPHWAVPHFLLGAELAELNRVNDAQTAMAQALLLDPELHMARFQMGLLQFLDGRTAVALLTWERLHRLDPRHSLQRAVSGFTALSQGQFGIALNLLSEAIHAADADPALAKNLEQLMERIKSAEASLANIP